MHVTHNCTPPHSTEGLRVSYLQHPLCRGQGQEHTEGQEDQGGHHQVHCRGRGGEGQEAEQGEGRGGEGRGRRRGGGGTRSMTD